MDDAVSRSCDVARQARPRRVWRNVNQVAASTTTPTMRIVSSTPVTTAPPMWTVGSGTLAGKSSG